MTHYAWAVWLAVPVAATVLAALWAWWRGRTRRQPGPRRAIAEHHAYLDALTQRAVDGQADASDPSAERAAVQPLRSPPMTGEARSIQ